MWDWQQEADRPASVWVARPHAKAPWMVLDYKQKVAAADADWEIHEYAPVERPFPTSTTGSVSMKR